MKPLVRSSNTKHMKNAVATAIACSILLVLPGCGIPKLRPAGAGTSACRKASMERPARKTRLRSGQPSFSMIRQLTSLIDQALVGNQQLRILAQDIAIANNEVLRRRGTYLPFVTFGAGASLDKLSTFTPRGSRP